MNDSFEQIKLLVTSLDAGSKRQLLHHLQSTLSTQVESVEAAFAEQPKSEVPDDVTDEMSYIIADSKRINWIEWGPYQVVVALLEDIPSLNLRRGQVGAVKQNIAPDMFEVEFIDVFGFTYATATLHVEQMMRLHFHLHGVDPNPSLRWNAAKS